MSYAKLHGNYIGVDPAVPETVYADRTAGGAWEDLAIVASGVGSTVIATFTAAQRVLSVQPDGRLETRPAGTNAAYEQLTVVDPASPKLCRMDGTTVVNTPLDLEGYQASSGTQSGFLRVSGNRFVDETGAPWLFAGDTNHTLISSISKGEDVAPLLAASRAAGATVLVTIGCHLSQWKRDNGFYYDPRRADHRDILARLFDLCAAADLRVAFAALADCQDVSESDQRAIWNTGCDVAAGRWNALMRIGNEGGEEERGGGGANGWNCESFSKRADLGGVLQSKGSVGADTVPSLSPWDFTEYESRRDLPKALLDANCLELAYGGWDANPRGIKGAIVNIEPAYFNDTDPDMYGDRRWTDPALAFRLGAQIGLESAGGGFGASDGLVCRPLQPVAAECRRQFFRGLKQGFAR